MTYRLPEPNPGSGKADQGTKHGRRITADPVSDHSPADQSQQWKPIGEIRAPKYGPIRYADFDTLADTRSPGIGNAVNPRRRTQHARKILPAATTAFAAASTPFLCYFNQGLAPLYLAHDGQYDGNHFRHHQRRSGAVSSKGRSFAATASLALKIRERTVPMGQFMIWAISS